MSLKDIALGQYIHGESFVHRLDPRTKLALMVFVTAALFSGGGWMRFVAGSVAIAAAAWASRIGAGVYARSLKPFRWLILVTVALNILFTGGHILVEAPLPFGGVTHEGIVSGLLYGGRIALLVLGASVLTHTTEPIALVDGIEKLLGPFRHIGVKPRETAVAMMLTIRFIPILHDEAVKIRKSLAARGIGVSGGLRVRIAGTVHLFMPLFHAAIRRADTLAVAMDCRLFCDQSPRTMFREPVMAARDWTTLAAGLLLTLAALILFH